jgi:hypothetical protein
MRNWRASGGGPERRHEMGGTHMPGGGIALELRNWGAGTLWARAAVELLVTSVRGKLAYPGAPWIERLGTGEDGKSYAQINPEKLVGGLDGMSSGERFVAKVVANLIDDETTVPLADIARLDPHQAGLVTAPSGRAWL